MGSRSLRFFRFFLSPLLAALLWPGVTQSFAQTQGDRRLHPPQIPQEQPPSPDDETRAQLEKDQAKKANQQRQEQIKRDTDQLLQLATELKAYVDKTNENILSLDVLKKADQIEKLAHSVKEKMRAE